MTEIEDLKYQLSYFEKLYKTLIEENAAQWLQIIELKEHLKSKRYVPIPTRIISQEQI